MALTHEQCIDLAVAEIHRLAEVADGLDVTAPVPTCEGWSIADLLLHIGQINRWAAAMVSASAQERLQREATTWSEPDDPADLPAWVDAGAGVVRDAFLPADPSTPMWAWGVPKTAGFWPRRMVHETGVHRADLELAIGDTPAFDPTVAADGVDELLDNLPEAAYFSPTVQELAGDGEVLALVATDLAKVGWRIELLPEGFTWIRTPGEPAGADATVAMPAGQLLLALYGRVPGVVDGSEELWSFWREKARI